MLHFHLICTVSVILILFVFLLVNVYIEAKSLHIKLYMESNILNIEQYREFNSYLVKFNKSYKGEEYMRRLKNFRDSLKEISKLNKLDPSSKHGLTKFTDMSREEFSRRMSINKFRGGLNYKCDDINMKKCAHSKHVEVDDDPSYDETLELKEKVDWRDHGVIGPVVDQKMCLACWAISSVGVMEAMAAINRGYRVSLSVQEMLDCGNKHGCGGGSMVNALRPLCRRRNKSITTEDHYKPTTMVDEPCNPDSTGLQTHVTWYKRICQMPEQEIMAKIAVGPVAVVINSEPLKSYIEGIIQYSCYRGVGIDHAVQIVGYDTTGDIPYYIVKNSWGEDFGIQGYIKIAMYKNVCGIADEVIYLNVTTI